MDGLVALMATTTSGGWYAQFDSGRYRGDLIGVFFVLIWRFPKLGLPPVIIHFNRISPCKPSILGLPHLWKPPYMYN